MLVRTETPADISTIRALTEAAFLSAEHSSGTEGAIVDALRDAQALTLSLVAEQDGAIIGHVAFSPVLIDGQDIGWFGLGPIAVAPHRQRSGAGAALMREGLARLRSLGANGCVVLGDPDYYSRFGFSSAHDLRYGDVPAEYFQSLTLHGQAVSGEVSYHEGFNAA